MNKKILVLILTTITAGSMLSDVSNNDTENHGFLASLGIGVKDIIESPAHIGQGGSKDRKKTKESDRKMKNKKSKENSDQKSKRSRRRPTDERS